MSNPFALSNIQLVADEQAQPASSNPFALPSIERDQRQDLRVNLMGAVRENPDSAAEAARLAKRYPAPERVILRNLQDVKLQAAVDAADERLQTSPKLARYLREQPFAAAQAHDDIEVLAQIENVLSQTWRSAKSGVYGASRGAAGVFQAGAELVAPVLDPLEQVAAIGGNPLRRLAEGFAMIGQQNLATQKSLRPQQPGGNIESGFYSGVESLTQNLIALPMAFAPGGQGAALSMLTASTGGQAYQDARGKGIPMAQALPFAASQAAIEYATEKLPLARLLGDVKVGTPFFQMLAKQIALEVPGEQIATVLQDLNEWAVLNPEKPFSDYIAERPDAAAQTLVATIVGAGGNVAVVQGIQSVLDTATNRAQQIDEAQSDAERLKALLGAAEASKLRERNPESFRQAMDRLADRDGEQDSIYIDAHVLQQSMAPEMLARLLPSVADQIDAAAAANAPVQVPMAEILAAAPGTPLAEVFLQNARRTPDSMSQAEAKEAGTKAAEFLQQEAARVIQQANDAQAMQESSDRVRQQLLDQLTQVGRFRQAVNEGYATWAAAFYTTMAGRMGMTPEAFAAKYPLRIVGETGAAGQVMDQSDDRDLIITHNLTAANLLHAKKMGGIAVPSLAVTKKDTPLTGFGEITLIGDKNMADPKGYASTKVFGADIYSPRYPSVEFKLDSAGLKKLNAVLAPYANGREIYGDEVRRLDDLTGIRAFKAYAGEKAGGTADWSQLKELAQELLVQVGADERIFQGFTPSGNRKYIPHTLENVVKILKKELRGGESFNYGVGSLRAKFTPQFKSLAAIKKEKGRLVSAEEFEPVKKEVNDELVAIAEQLGLSMDQTIEVFEDAPKMGVTRAIDRAVKDYRSSVVVDDEIKQRVAQFLTRLRNLPTAYFEAKILRDVSPAEFKAAVVPDDISADALAYLRENVSDIRTYKAGDEADRAARIGELNDLFFQQSRGSFNPQSLELALSPTADLSTFFHETGHFFLEVMADIATQPDAPAEIQADMGKLLEWFGIKGDESVGGTDSGAPLEQPAYHGTPHRGIDKFSADKIGTGEGAQAYGWGLYFAGKKEIAEWYREKLSKTSIHYDGKPINPTDDAYRTAQDALTLGFEATEKKLQEIIDKYAERSKELNGKGPFGQMVKNAKARLEWLRSLDPEKLKDDGTPGQLYEVDIPEDSEMLLWDKPLSEQPEAVRKALQEKEEAFFVEQADKAGMSLDDYERMLIDTRSKYPPQTRNGIDGGDFYRELVDYFGGQKAASEYLSAAGIKGIKYLDGISRGAGDGTFNYVVFSGDDVAIKNRFYQDGPTPDAPPIQPRRTPLETWRAMTLDQKRPYHERFAESIEQYLMEGKAPSTELAPLFRKFKAWVLNVYKSIKAFNASKPDAERMPLNDEVRRVFDRMLASEEQIAQAEEVAGMLPDEQATNDAIEKLTARSLRDMKWISNARSKAIKALQREAAVLRREVRIDARRDVMTEPVYRLWSFLSARMTEEDRAKTFAERAKADPAILDPSKDSMLAAVAKLGGIQRESAAQHLGVHADDFNHPSGVFGKPVFRVEGGRSADAMGELLAENGYLLPSEDGRYDLAELEELIQAEIRGEPQYSIAKQYFLESERGGEGVAVEELNAGRFDLADLKTLGLPEETIGKLEAMRMTLKKGGIHPDIIADSFGFPDGQTMIRELLASTPPLAAVEARTDQRMLEEHGDLVDQRAIEAAANEAIHNDARAKVLATELKAQAEALNPRRDTGEVNAAGRKITVNALLEAAKQFGANVVARTTLRDLRSRVSQHTAAERRAAKAWREATEAGKTREAVQAKQDQVLNNAAAKAAMDAIAEVRKTLDFFKRVTKGNDEKVVESGRDADLVNVARAVLAAYGVETGTTKKAGEYLDVLQKNDPDLWAVVQPMVEGATQNAQPLAALTVEQLQGLAEDIQAIWHLAKRSRQMEVDGDLMDIADAADELRVRMDAIGVPLEVPGEKGAMTKAEERGRWLQFAGSVLRRVEQWAEGMDGKFGGPFLRYVFQPVKAAADAYRTDRVKYQAQFAALLDSVGPSLRKGLIEAPELGYTFGKGHNGIGHAELLHAILHTGNESNKRKLLLGRRWATENMDGTLDTSRWDAFVKRMQDTGVLGKVHYDFAQGVWDLLESTKPLAQKTHRDVFGRYFAEVTADSFETPFGSYRGGYVPAQADPRIVGDAALRALANAENENMAFSFPTTSKGFTKSRVDYNRPLMLDLRTLGQHIDKVLLFSHMEPAVRSVNKLLRQKGVSQPLGRIDPSIYEGMLIPWLNRSARQQVETPIVGDGRISRVLSVVRQRAGMALMFANVSNTLQQITGVSTALVKVSGASMRSAVAQYIAHPKKTSEAVAAASEFMANRMDNQLAAINDTINDILLDPNALEKAQAWTMKHAYFMQSAFDNVIGPIVWTGAYNDALKQGMSERDAVKFADGTVRQTQGSTLAEDVSRIETGPAYARVFTQFIGYFNMMANTNATAIKQIADEVGLKRGAGKTLYVVTMGLLVPIWVAEAIAQAMRGGPDDEDKDGWYIDDWLAAVFGFGTIKGLFATVPFVGQLAVAGVNRITSNPNDDRVSMSPAVSMLEAGVGAPMSVYKALAEDGSKQKAVRDLASLLSIATGLPVSAAAKPVGYLAGVADDRIVPTGPADAARGLVSGTASPDSKIQR